MKATAIKTISIGTVFATAIVFGACTEDNANAASEKHTSGSSTQIDPMQVKSSFSPEAQKSITQMLAAYEQIRAKLARDEIAAIADDASTLRKMATTATAGAPSELRSQLTSVAGAAGSLKEMAKTDADAVRKAFGEISRPLVALLSRESSLQQGKHIFECPMAQGYKKWVQASTKISNPYMGTRMLECGASSKWKE